MPVNDCQSNGKPGKRWGQSGKCFVFEPGDEAGRKRATAKAARQGRAIRARQRRADAKEDKKKILAPPKGLTDEYRARLRKRVRETHKFTTARIKAAGENVTAAIIRAAEKLWKSRHAPVESWLKGLANRAEKSATDRNNTVIARVAKIDVSKLPSGKAATAVNKAFVRENVKLIKSIDTRYFNDVAKVVREAVEAGTSTKQLSKLLSERFEVSDARADLIARDQLNKINGNITQARQQDLGIEKYEWATAEDERVRESHAALDGKIFSWDDPPAIGHPGEPINCRCVAIAIVED